MAITDFLKTLTEHWQADLPFVAYRKPNTATVQALLQQSDTLVTVRDFSESGFVMAPFDKWEDAILLPLELCDAIQAEFTFKQPFQAPLGYTDTSYESQKEAHLNLVSKGIQAIRGGNLDKVVLSRQERVKGAQSPIKLFEKLLEAYPTAFVFLWHHTKASTWLGATPETLLTVENNTFSTMALAGTQAYKGTTNVAWGDKEREEQAIVTREIVENLRNNVNSITVSEPVTTKAGNLLHLKTNISGTLRNADLTLLLSCLHPTSAVCGFPKKAAKAFILENEGYDRAFYTGFLGELHVQESKTRNANRRNVENNAYGTVKKVSNLFVTLRCMQWTNEAAILYSGGGITKDSNPEAEWLETVHKTKTMKNII